MSRLSAALALARTAGKRGAGFAVGALMGILIPLVGGFEGLRLEAYLDPVGIPTICYGHTDGVTLGQTKTQEECDELLAAELGEAVAAVERHVTVYLPVTRKAALASFVYNVGETAFRKSTLLRLLNAGETRAACDQLLRWVHASGQKLPGLVKRREKERELCLAGL